MSEEYLYRFEDKEYGYLDDEGYSASQITRIVVYLNRYRVIKKTPKGRWIQLYDFSDTKKFVLDGKGKRFAYPTIELAKESFNMRKTKQIQRCERTIRRAKIALESIDNYTRNWD